MNARKSYPLLVIADGLLARHVNLTTPTCPDDFGAILENPTEHGVWS